LHKLSADITNHNRKYASNDKFSLYVIDFVGRQRRQTNDLIIHNDVTRHQQKSSTFYTSEHIEGIRIHHIILNTLNNLVLAYDSQRERSSTLRSRGK